jgi:VWFA-related protein
MRPSRTFIGALLLAAALPTFSRYARAQEQVPAQAPVLTLPTDGAQPYKLHVYTTLVQVPTLITDTDGKPIPGLTRNDIRISLDEGPTFAPTMVRLEGDDPLSLSVLLDASGDQRPMLRTFADDFAKAAAPLLRPGDRITFHSIDCMRYRTAIETDPTPERIHRGIEKVLAAPGLHGDQPKQGCRRSLHILDAITQDINELATKPGRRVLVIISEVRDHGSTMSLGKLVTYAGANGVAVFGLRDAASHDADVEMSRALADAGPLRDAYGDNLAALVRHNGGLIFNVEPLKMPLYLPQLMDDIRSRYILEFSRPNKQEAGLHGIEVTVPAMRVFTHPAGVSTTLPDPTLLNDPTTIPTADSPAIMGTHRPKQP